MTTAIGSRVSASMLAAMPCASSAMPTRPPARCLGVGEGGLARHAGNRREGGIEIDEAAAGGPANPRRVLHLLGKGKQQLHGAALGIATTTAHEKASVR